MKSMIRSIFGRVKTRLRCCSIESICSPTTILLEVKFVSPRKAHHVRTAKELRSMNVTLCRGVNRSRENFELAVDLVEELFDLVMTKILVDRLTQKFN